MKTQFYILLSLKTPRGFETYGQYFLGNDRKAADELFAQLAGDSSVTQHTLLHMDLMETVDDLPVKIRTIGCTLDELANNCKLITKETFRRLTLKDW